MFNLDPDTTNEHLVWLFGKYGAVKVGTAGCVVPLTGCGVGRFSMWFMKLPRTS